MAGEPIVLLLTLALFNLGQATTCQGDNCPTGLVISGGYRTETSIETFPANCTIPPFPAPGREGHTLSVVGRQLVACGGEETETSCIAWRSGQEEWTHYATLSQKRSGHAAVSISNKIIILGGSSSSKRSGEIVNEGGSQFTLQNGGSGTCALNWEDGFLTIGGRDGRNTHGKVDRYNSEGKYLDSLPDLFTPRAYHACTSFFTNGEQALLVAGGASARLVSTEIYSNGKWSTGGNLPRALPRLRAAHLNQQVVVTGGYVDGSNARDEVLQYNVETGAWTQMDKKMQSPRGSHAIIEANLATFGCAASGATTTTGLDPLLALLTCLVLVSCRRCNNSSTLRGENKQSL